MIRPDPHILGLARLAARFTMYRVRYCAIGGFATAMYLPQREPDDLDVVIAPSARDGEKALAALWSLARSPEARVCPSSLVTTPDLLAEGDQLIVPTAFGTMHILGAHLPAESDREAIVGRRRWVIRGSYPVAVCDIEDLLQIKQAAQHKHDDADVQQLLAAFPTVRAGNPRSGSDTDHPCITKEFISSRTMIL